jgi:hypothetical protein
MKASIDLLDPEHRNHLLAEGFTHELIKAFVLNGLVKSLTPEEAYKTGFSVAIDGIPVAGGLQFQFSPTFAQLRLDNQNIIPKDRAESSSKYAKYLSLGGAIDLGCAYIPDGCKAVTEGMKDALAFTHHGDIPTGAVAGVSHINKALPKDCGYTIVFDYDAWENFEVFKNLIRAGVHCNGKVAIVPQIEDEPKAGGCEYFKAGNTADDYKRLLENAKTPIDLFKTWFDRQEIIDVTTAVELAVNASKLIGELFGYASSAAVERIKDTLKNSKLSEWNLTASNILRDSGNTQSSQKAMKANDKGEGDTDPRKVVKIAIDIVKERADLFHSQSPDSEDYASIPSKTGAVMTTHAIDSREFKSWLTGEYYRETGEGLTGEQMNSVIATIHAIAAHDSPELPVSEKRVAECNGRYYLCLADDAQTVIEYSATGWHVCENSPVRFVFDRYKSPLPIPQRDGKIDKLWDIVRIAEPSDRLAVAAILVKALVPGGGEPILALSGYAGSGKTTSAKYLRSLLDPFNKGGILAKIPDLDSMAIHGKKRIFISIDNLSHVTADQSNLLAGVSTGTGDSKRKHYSDGDEVLIDIQNIIILTSIGNVVNKSDLLSRSINIELARLTDEQRASESTLEADFNTHHAAMLGGLLNMTVAALNHRDTTKSPNYSRMTNFIHLGDGVEKHLGYEGVTLSKRLKIGEREANTIAIESSPTASILVNWLQDKNEWEGLTSELLNILKSHAKKSDQSGVLPKNAIKLSAELKMIEWALLEQGIEITAKRRAAGMYISISRKEVKGDLSTLSTQNDEDKPCKGSAGVEIDVDNKIPSTQSSGLSTSSASDVDRPHSDVEVKKDSTSLNTLLEPLLDEDSVNNVDSVDRSHLTLVSPETHIEDPEYPYINGDV